MASTASKGRKKTPAKTGRGGAKGGKQKTTRKPSAAELQAQSAITSEIILIGVLALTILLFLCNFGVIGVIGNQISRVMFGIFGTMAYALPVLAFIAIAFGISNQGNRIASMKLTAGIILFFLLGVVCSLLFQGGTLSMDYSIRELYLESAEKRLGEEVEIRLYKPVDKCREFTGVLKSYDADSITIDTAEKEMTFARKEIALIRLALDF